MLKGIKEEVRSKVATENHHLIDNYLPNSSEIALIAASSSLVAKLFITPFMAPP
jgi:hypothetical protein